MHIYWSFRALILLVKDSFSLRQKHPQRSVAAFCVQSVHCFLCLFSWAMIQQLDQWCPHGLNSRIKTQAFYPCFVWIHAATGKREMFFRKWKKIEVWILGQAGSCKFCLICLLKFVTFQTWIQVIIAKKNEVDESHISQTLINRNKNFQLL